jgi:hypothetical protein
MKKKMSENRPEAVFNGSTDEIAVISVGNGANNVQYRAEKLFRKQLEQTRVDPNQVKLYAINTNPRGLPLLESRGIKTLHIRHSENTMGAGFNPKTGRESFFRSRNSIESMLGLNDQSRRIAMACVIASPMKGTGGGATEPLALMLRKRGIPVIIWALVPDDSEGNKTQVREAFNRVKRWMFLGFPVIEVRNEYAYDQAEANALINQDIQERADELNQFLNFTTDQVYAFLDEKIVSGLTGLISVYLDNTHNNTDVDPDDINTNIFPSNVGRSVAIAAYDFSDEDFDDETVFASKMGELLQFPHCIVPPVKDIKDSLITQHGTWTAPQTRKLGRSLNQLISSAGFFPIRADYSRKPTLRPDNENSNVDFKGEVKKINIIVTGKKVTKQALIDEAMHQYEEDEKAFNPWPDSVGQKQPTMLVTSVSSSNDSTPKVIDDPKEKVNVTREESKPVAIVKNNAASSNGNGQANVELVKADTSTPHLILPEAKVHGTNGNGNGSANHLGDGSLYTKAPPPATNASINAFTGFAQLTDIACKETRGVSDRALTLLAGNPENYKFTDLGKETRLKIPDLAKGLANLAKQNEGWRQRRLSPLLKDWVIKLLNDQGFQASELIKLDGEPIELSATTNVLMEALQYLKENFVNETEKHMELNIRYSLSVIYGPEVQTLLSTNFGYYKYTPPGWNVLKKPALLKFDKRQIQASVAA